MTRKLILLLSCILLRTLSFAQSDSLFVRAQIITLSDTLKGYISRDFNLDRFVEFKYDSQMKDAIRINIDSISRMWFDKMEFTCVLFEGESFMVKVEAEGLVSIYTDYKSNLSGSFSGGGNFQGGYFVDRIVYYLRFDGRVYLIRSSNIGKLIDMAFGENPDMVDTMLALKYKDLVDSLPVFASEYNRKYAGLLPDGKLIPLVQQEANEISRFGFYLPLSVNYPLVYVTRRAREDMFNNSRGRLGFSIGAGFYYSLSAKARFYLDLNYAINSMHLDYTDQLSDLEAKLRVVENATFHYLTLNPKLEFGFESFSTGFGVTFSVYNNYKTSYKTYSNDGEVSSIGDERTPILVKDKKNIFSFNYFIAKTIKLKNTLKFSPIVSLSIPVNNSIDIGEKYVDEELHEYVQDGVMPFVISLGIRLEFN